MLTELNSWAHTFVSNIMQHKTAMETSDGVDNGRGMYQQEIREAGEKSFLEARQAYQGPNQEIWRNLMPGGFPLGGGPADTSSGTAGIEGDFFDHLDFWKHEEASSTRPQEASINLEPAPDSAAPQRAGLTERPSDFASAAIFKKAFATMAKDNAADVVTTTRAASSLLGAKKTADSTTQKKLYPKCMSIGRERKCAFPKRRRLFRRKSQPIASEPLLTLPEAMSLIETGVTAAAEARYPVQKKATAQEQVL